MLTDVRVRQILGADARFVHFDCSEREIPTDRPIGRLVRRLFEAAPVSRMAFGNFFLTDAEGATLYGVRPCSCRRQGPLRMAADLLRLASRTELAPDPEVDFVALETAARRFRLHAELRKTISAGGDPAMLREFEASLPDPLVAAYPCRMVDQARISSLTLGCLQGSGGNSVGLERTLDPTSLAGPALRNVLTAGLTDAALRDEPCHEEAGPHLAVAYLLLARDEIDSAVATACRARDCTPADLALHMLPIPRAARERAARLALVARGIVVPAGDSALELLRRTLN